MPSGPDLFSRLGATAGIIVTGVLSLVTVAAAIFFFGAVIVVVAAVVAAFLLYARVRRFLAGPNGDEREPPPPYPGAGSGGPGTGEAAAAPGDPDDARFVEVEVVDAAGSNGLPPPEDGEERIEP